jgi:hypothetical protein
MNWFIEIRGIMNPKKGFQYPLIFWKEKEGFSNKEFRFLPQKEALSPLNLKHSIPAFPST